MKRAIKSHQQKGLQKILLLPEDHPGMEQPATGDWVVQVNRGIQSLVDFHELKLHNIVFIRFLNLSLRTRRKWQNNQQDDCGH